jgi:hypothetical protein
VHNGKLQGAVNVILASNIFKKARTDEPFTIDKNAPKTEQGTGAVFDPEEYGIIGTGYTACCNLFWLNMFHSVVPGVPVNSGQVDNLKNHFFKHPTAGGYPMIVRVAVCFGQDIVATKGALVSLSPLEMVHAFILRIAEEITSGADTDRLKTWRQMMLTVTFAFETIDSNDDRHWRSVELREAEGIVGDKS